MRIDKIILMNKIQIIINKKTRELMIYQKNMNLIKKKNKILIFNKFIYIHKNKINKKLINKMSFKLTKKIYFLISFLTKIIKVLISLFQVQVNFKQWKKCRIFHQKTSKV